MCIYTFNCKSHSTNTNPQSKPLYTMGWKVFTIQVSYLNEVDNVQLYTIRIVATIKFRLTPPNRIQSYIFVIITIKKLKNNTAHALNISDSQLFHLRLMILSLKILLSLKKAMRLLKYFILNTVFQAFLYLQQKHKSTKGRNITNPK